MIAPRVSSRSRRAAAERARSTRGRIMGVALALALVAALLGMSAADASAAAPWWQLNVESAPSNLPPGGEGTVIMAASNLGDAPDTGTPTDPLIMTAKLPLGLKATSVTTIVVNEVTVECSITTIVTCSYAGRLNPYERVAIPITVAVEGASETATGLPIELSAEGGGGARVSATDELRVSAQPTPFGISTFEVRPSNESGSPATQAGGHPFQLTTTLVLNQTAERQPAGLPKDLSFVLPPGLIGNPKAASQCTMSDFIALVEETNLCAVSSVVGVATVTANEPKYSHIFTKTVPVFNLVPSQGEPARLGFDVLGKVPIVIDTSVRTGKDYAVVASVRDASETAGLLSSQVTLWGNPGAGAHDNARGWECVAGDHYAKQIGKACPATSAEPEAAFLTNPTACAQDPAAEPVRSSTEADSWANPGIYLGSEYAWMNSEGTLLGFEGCEQLPFGPQIEVHPDTDDASTPAGLEVNVEIPQESTLEPGGLAEADVRDTTVTLPRGMELSPSAANGLEACSEAQIGFVGVDQRTNTDQFTDEKPSCPDGSKVGTVKIETPLLSHELEGSVYLASPAPNGEGGRNPFNSLIALYIVAQDPVSGVLVKLAGEGQINEQTLQVQTSFKNTPEVPFEELELNLFGGPRASLSTPQSCGSYQTEALFTPYSSETPVSVGSEGFPITAGPGSAQCPSQVAFSPGFLAQSESPNAGAFTNFDLELSRPDGDQALTGLTMHLPPGVAALLSSVELCNEPDAAASTCPASSEIGKATAIAGLGPDPYTEQGRVYITGPYRGAPFGLEIVTPAVAGPFDLGTVTVRSKLDVDPTNASVTITSDPLPTELRGIPLQLKRVLVSVNRPNFEFNPTNCSPMKLEGMLAGAEGASADVSSSFQVQNCARLPFKPTFKASTDGHASKADGAAFIVMVTSGGTDSQGVAQQGIAKVDLELPKALPARLSTLQKACTEAAFNQNPASCPEDSNIGSATIHTPVLRKPLTGPAYLVSHGNAAFPDVEFVLQGEGITLILDGKTQIKNGVTYSKFESAPDAPFTVFETALPQGPHSALTANVPEREHFDLCGNKLSMPTEMTSQAGTVIKQSTTIQILGCGSVKATRVKKLTRAQKLKKALASCHQRFRRNRHGRVACERRAGQLYGPVKHKHGGKGAR